LHDGKWLLIRVDNLKTLEAVKKLILIKKKPNRKPLSKDNALYGKCGLRCDLCIHYTGITDEYREMIISHHNAVYGVFFLGHALYRL
jgi:predicted GIY-YIG superfamily endonuclease